MTLDELDQLVAGLNPRKWHIRRVTVVHLTSWLIVAPQIFADRPRRRRLEPDYQAAVAYVRSHRRR